MSKQFVISSKNRRLLFFGSNCSIDYWSFLQTFFRHNFCMKFKIFYQQKTKRRAFQGLTILMLYYNSKSVKEYSERPHKNMYGSPIPVALLLIHDSDYRDCNSATGNNKIINPKAKSKILIRKYLFFHTCWDLVNECTDNFRVVFDSSNTVLGEAFTPPPTMGPNVIICAMVTLFLSKKVISNTNN